MFLIRCVVSTNKLEDALRGLKGHTLEAPVVEVVDDMPRNESYKTAAKPPHSLLNGAHKPRKAARRAYSTKRNEAPGGAKAVIEKLIAETSEPKITSKQVINAAKAAGYRPGSHSHGLALLMKEGTLSRLDHGVYAIRGR